MIRIPIPAGVAGPIAIIGGILIASAIPILITAKERTPVSPGTRLGTRIVGGVAAAWGLLMMLGWISPALHVVSGSHGFAALLFGFGALAFAWGQEALIGAIVAGAGAVLIAGVIWARYAGHVYGALLMPSVVLVLLGAILFARRSRAPA